MLLQQTTMLQPQSQLSVAKTIKILLVPLPCSTSTRTNSLLLICASTNSLESVEQQSRHSSQCPLMRMQLRSNGPQATRSLRYQHRHYQLTESRHWRHTRQDPVTRTNPYLAITIPRVHIAASESNTVLQTSSATSIHHQHSTVVHSRVMQAHPYRLESSEIHLVPSIHLPVQKSAIT